VKEIWELAISGPMLPLTILLVPVALFWLLSIIGAVDHDFMGVDLDGHDGGHNHDHPVFEWIHGTLRILNAREVPVMIVLSVLVIFLWCCAMLGNLWFNPDASGWRGGIVSIGALVSAVVITRFAVSPLKPLFRLVQDDPETGPPIIGRTGTVRTAHVNEREGQVEVEHRGAPLLLHARTAEGSPPLSRGTEILVIHHDPETGIHIVRAL
jgi:hypothetical protein